MARRAIYRVKFLAAFEIASSACRAY